jgi:cold shock CspA family protein
MQRGFGLIVPDDGGVDVFVLISAVEKADYDGLVEGVKVSYELVNNKSGLDDRGEPADRVRPAAGAACLRIGARWPMCAVSH